MATLIYTSPKGTQIYRSNKLDVYGKPRVIVHYLDLLTPDESARLSVSDGYALAASRARQLSFRKYTAREFGGGFIRQYDYNGGQEIAEQIDTYLQTI